MLLAWGKLYQRKRKKQSNNIDKLPNGLAPNMISIMLASLVKSDL